MSLPPKQNEKKNSLKATKEIISASSKNSITPRSSPTPDPQHPNWRARQRGDVLSSTAEGTARFGVWGQRGSAGRASRALGSGVPGAPRVVQGGTNTVTDCCLQLVVPGVLLPPGSSLACSNSEQIWMGWTLSSHDVGSLLGKGLSSIYSSVEKLKCFSS